MNIARSLAGYSLGQADLLRRAMGKKIASEMAKEHDRFVKGAAGRRVSFPRWPNRFSNRPQSSPVTASTRDTPPLMPRSRIRPHF